MNLLIILIVLSACVLIISSFKYFKNAKNLIIELETNHNDIWKEIGEPNVYSILTVVPSMENGTDFLKQKSFLRWLNFNKLKDLNPMIKQMASATRKNFYIAIFSTILFLLLVSMCVFCLFKNVDGQTDPFYHEYLSRFLNPNFSNQPSSIDKF